MNGSTDHSKNSGGGSDADGFTYHLTRDSQDTVDLRYAVRRGPVPPKRWVLFLNGRTEWIEKYAYLPGDLRLPDDCGYLTWDHRGQGASGGARAFVDSYDTFAQDAAVIVKEAIGDAPYAVVSHSMGALIALYSVLTGQLRPTTLVLSSPLLGLPNDPVPRPLARPLAELLTRLRLGAVSSGAGSFTNIPFEANRLTHNADLYRRMQNNPYKIPGATFSWVTATFKALETAFDPAVLARLTVPTLVLGGSEETVVDPQGMRSWVQSAAQHAAGDVQLRLFPGAKHELFSELPEYYEPATAAVRGWLKGFLQA